MRDTIKQKLEKLDNMNKSDYIDYKYFEVALLLYLRSDLDEFDDLSILQLGSLYNLVDKANSLLQIDYESVDYILGATDEELLEDMGDDE